MKTSKFLCGILGIFLMFALVFASLDSNANAKDEIDTVKTELVKSVSVEINATQSPYVMKFIVSSGFIFEGSKLVPYHKGIESTVLPSNEKQLICRGKIYAPN